MMTTASGINAVFAAAISLKDVNAALGYGRADAAAAGDGDRRTTADPATRLLVPAIRDPRQQDASVTPMRPRAPPATGSAYPLATTTEA
jgi:hypothetical protein